MRTKVSILFLFVLLLGLNSCKNSSKSKVELTDENSVLLQDKFGEVHIPLSPSRVIPYNYGVLDNLEALGLTSRVIGFSKSNTPDYLKKFKEEESLVDFGDTKDLNFEKINKANPEFIIAEPQIKKDHEELAQIAPTLYMGIDYKDYIGSIIENVETLGKIFEVEDRAVKLIEELENTISKNQDKNPTKRGLVIMFNNQKFQAFGSNSRYGFIYDDFGIIPVSDNMETSIHGYSISREYIKEQNPDILFAIDENAAHHQGDINKKEVENNLIKETNAYKNNKIFYLTPDLWYYGGGGIQAMGKMAKEIGQAF